MRRSPHPDRDHDCTGRVGANENRVRRGRVAGPRPFDRKAMSEMGLYRCPAAMKNRQPKVRLAAVSPVSGGEAGSDQGPGSPMPIDWISARVSSILVRTCCDVRSERSS